MNRRKFLGLLAIAPIVAKAAPALKFLETPKPLISGYYDYTTFSEMAYGSSIDPIILAAAKELAHQEALRIDALTLAFNA